MKSFLLTLAIALTCTLGISAQATPLAVSVDTVNDATISIAGDSQPETISVDYLDDEPALSDQPLKKEISLDFKIVQIFGLLIPFGSAIIIVGLFFFYLNRRQRNKLRIIELAITNNYPLPPAYYQGKWADPHRYLLTGIYWIGGGLAACLTFVATCDDVWAIGLFPIFIGLARVAVYFAKTKSSKRNNDQQG